MRGFPWAIGAALLVAGGSSASQPQAAGESSAEMRNVDLRLDPKLTLHVHWLRGKLLRVNPQVPPTFDDKHSFILAIDAAEVGITTTDLSYLMNHYVFGYRGSPLKGIRITAEGDRLKQKGVLHKGIDVPFEMEGTLAATADGKILMHPEKFKALHLPAKGIMHLFGLEVDDLIDAKGARGATIVKNDLILDPERMLPPPQIRGRVTAVRVQGDQVIQIFGQGAPPAASAKNYMHFRSGTIRFGKLTMRDADLELIDAQPRDAFEFFLDHYKDQLVAGYSKTTPSFGLEVYMPDFAKIGSRGRAARSARERH